MIGYELGVLEKIIKCLIKLPLVAPRQDEDENKPNQQLRIGWGGDMAISPPVGLVLALAMGGIVTLSTGMRGRFARPVLCRLLPVQVLSHRCEIPLRLALGVAVAKLGSFVKRASDQALAQAGTSADMETPVELAIATTGPYATLRHPLYAATFVIPTALGIILDNAVLALTANFGWALYAQCMAIPAEERFLSRGKLGKEYKKYCASVKQWGFF